MKKLPLLIIIAFLFYAAFACKKKLFKHVEMQGRMLNYITKSPISATIYVSAYESRGHRHSLDLGSFQTENDGSFYIRTSAVKPEKYYIDIIGNEGIFGAYCAIPDGSIKNFGDILVGKFTFICKVTIVPISNNAIDFPFLETGALHFNSGTSTQFITKRTIESNYFNNEFTIAFDTNGVRTVKSIPISTSSPQDTLFTTINY